MAKFKGYGSYRGRSPMRTFLKFVIILLASVLILAVIALVFLQQYIVYSADGVHLELPFLSSAEPSAPPEYSAVPVVTEPMVVETPEVVQPDWLNAVSLPREALYDGTAGQQLESAGGNAAIFDMKADDGSLGYVSDLPLAISAKVSSGDAAVNAAIRALNEGEIYTIARVSCFKDHNLSNADRSLAITTNSGYRWTDPDKIRWISPTSETVRRYLADVCAELADLGFDEILLVNSAYPTEGNLNYIKKGEAYDKSAFSQVIDGFYAQVAAALEGYDVKLSILTDQATVADGENELSGQTLDGITGCADRIWVSGADETTLQALSDAGLSDENIVCAAESPGGDTSSWAVLNAWE